MIQIPVLNPYGLICGGLSYYLSRQSLPFHSSQQNPDCGQRNFEDRQYHEVFRHSAIIGDLNIDLPQDFDCRHVVINLAMDVRSASMLFYISDEHITGPEDYYLKFTVGQYNAALAKFHVRIGIKAY